MLKTCCAGWLAALFAFGYAGCASQISTAEDHARAWVGKSFDEYKLIRARTQTYADEIGWPNEVSYRDNDRLVFMVPLREQCFVHFTTDAARTIVAYKLVGRRCD